MATKSVTFESKNVQDILFPVEKVEFDQFSANSDYQYQIVAYPEIPTTKSIVDKDGNMTEQTIMQETKLLVNACSDRYNLVPNSEIFVPIKEMIDNAKMNYTEKYSMINFSRFYADINFMEKGFEVENGDIIFPRLKITHSYNGLTKYSMIFGYFREICENGLTVPVSEKSEFNLSYRGKHTALLNHRFEELIERVNLFTNSGEQIIQKFKTMADVWVKNPNDRIIEVLNANKIAVVDNANFNTLNYINQIILRETLELHRNDKVNDWHIYNGINQYLAKNPRINDAPEVTEEKDLKVLHYMLAHPA